MTESDFAETDATYHPLSESVLDNPFDAYRELRDGCPVHHTADFRPDFYTLSRFDDVNSALEDRDGCTWSAKFGSSPQFNRALGFNQDPPDNNDFRKMFRGWFSATVANRNRGLIDDTIKDLLDAMTKNGRQHGDFATEFAVLLPIRVIAHLLGIPPEDAPELKEMTDDFLGAFGVPDPKAVMPAVARLDRYFAPHLEHRRQLLATAGLEDPDKSVLGDTVPDDLLSFMLVAKYHDRHLTPAELSYVLATALTGGNDTTTSMLTNVVYRLLEQPDLWKKVVADGTLVENAIEESLRLDPPVLGLFRTNAAQLELHDRTIAAQSKVMLLFGSANRDPRHWPDADEFRLDRPLGPLRKHLAFGAGIHFCLGAPLARLEGVRALDILRARLPDLRANGPSERVRQFHLWGRRTLPVRWDPPTNDAS